jgi:molybdenum cofactor biosynthesis protein B
VSTHGHHDEGRGSVTVHVIAVSSTRTAATDGSGRRIAELVTRGGHVVGSHAVVDDDVQAIRKEVEARVAADAEVVVLTGGTGVAPRDVTPEAVEPLFTRRLEGFGELFRSLSYGEIGAAAMLSRATAGLVGATVVFVVPGSTAACELAVGTLILPELGHLVKLARPYPARS